MHMYTCKYNLGFVQSLYRACSWLVHVQGILQASIVSKCITYKTWVWIIFLLHFVNNIYHRQVENSFIKSSAYTSGYKIMHVVNVCAFCAVLDVHAHICSYCLHCMGTLCSYIYKYSIQCSVIVVSVYSIVYT